jgi:hypothetical protein
VIDEQGKARFEQVFDQLKPFVEDVLLPMNDCPWGADDFAALTNTDLADQFGIKLIDATRLNFTEFDSKNRSVIQQ